MSATPGRPPTQVVGSRTYHHLSVPIQCGSWTLRLTQQATLMSSSHLHVITVERTVMNSPSALLSRRCVLSVCPIVRELSQLRLCGSLYGASASFLKPVLLRAAASAWPQVRRHRRLCAQLASLGRIASARAPRAQTRSHVVHVDEEKATRLPFRRIGGGADVPTVYPSLVEAGADCGPAGARTRVSRWRPRRKSPPPLWHTWTTQAWTTPQGMGRWQKLTPMYVLHPGHASSRSIDARREGRRRTSSTFGPKECSLCSPHLCLIKA